MKSKLIKEQDCDVETRKILKDICRVVKALPNTDPIKKPLDRICEERL